MAALRYRDDTDLLVRPTHSHGIRALGGGDPRPPFVVGIGGTLRPGSSSEAALAVALAAAKANGAEVQMISGPDLRLPMYVPGEADRTREATRLIALIDRADGVIFSSPGYHGTVSGLVKNAIDYIEDLRAAPRVYLDGRAVGCIACAGGWQAAGQTLSTLRSIVHALRGWPTPVGAMLNTSTKMFDESGTCVDAMIHGQLEMIGRQVVTFALLSRQASSITA